MTTVRELSTNRDRHGLDGNAVVGILGANGFIGRHLVRRLAKLGIACVAISRSFPADFAETVADVECRSADLLDPAATRAAIRNVTHLVQLANSSGPGLGNSNLSADLAANVLPHIGCIDSCLSEGVAAYIFMSSGGTVYGAPNVLPIPETHANAPLNSYGMTKFVAEQYLRLMTQGSQMRHTVLRVSNAFGPGQDVNRGQGLIAAILRQHDLGLPVTIFGDGMALRDYIYIDDVVDAIIASLSHVPATQTVFNIGSGVGRSILDVVDAIEEIVGASIDRLYVPARTTDASSNILDVAAAARDLGWTPRTSFTDGLRSTSEAWHREKIGHATS